MKRKVAADYYKFFFKLVIEKVIGTKMVFSIFSSLIRSIGYKYSGRIFPPSAISFSIQKKDAAPVGAKNNVYNI